MSQRDLLRMVLSNLNRMRGRVALTATGVLIGTAAIVILISLGVGLQTSTAEEIGAFGDFTLIQVFRGSPLGIDVPGDTREPEAVLDSAAIEEIQELPGVVAATPRLQVQGMLELRYGRDSYRVRSEGIEADAAPQMEWQLASGMPRLGGGQIVVGQEVFRSGNTRRFPGAESRVAQEDPAPSPEELQGRTVLAVLSKISEEDGTRITRSERLRIAGVFEKQDNQNDWAIYMSLDDVESINQWYSGSRRDPREGYSQALVKVDDRESVQAVQEAIREMGFETYSNLDVLEAVNQVFLIMEAVLGAIGGVTLLVAAFGIANTMTMAIYERTREIGIMKAIGATNRDVLRIFLFEAGAIGIIGGVLGVLTGLAVGQGLELFVRSQVQGPPSGAPEQEATRLVITPLWLIVFAIGFAAVVGLLSGIYPAMRAASMKPLRALRTE